jgi:acyl-CoA thioester hydrolase
MARHSFRCPMRWSDMDAYGHVNNVTYLVYLEEARVSLFDRMDLASPLETGVVVARHEIDYKRPLVHRIDPVIVDIWVEHVSRRSWTFRHVIRDDDGVVYALASTVMVGWDLAGERSRDLTEDERRQLLTLTDEEIDG